MKIGKEIKIHTVPTRTPPIRIVIPKEKPAKPVKPASTPIHVPNWPKREKAPVRTTGDSSRKPA